MFAEKLDVIGKTIINLCKNGKANEDDGLCFRAGVAYEN